MISASKSALLTFLMLVILGSSLFASPQIDPDLDPEFAELAFATGWQEQLSGSPATNDFAKWTDRYLAASTSAARSQMLKEGVDLASLRREEILTLIRTHPATAIAHTVPKDALNELPSEIVELLEHRVSDRGDLSRLASSVPPLAKHVAASTFHTAAINGIHYRAYVKGRRAAGSKRDIFLWGISVNGEMAVADSPLRVLETRESAEVPDADKLPCPMCGDADNAIGKGSQICVQVGDQIATVCSKEHLRLLLQQTIRDETASGPYPQVKQSLRSAVPRTKVSSLNTSKALLPTSWTFGPKKLLFILVDFSDLSGTPYDTNYGESFSSASILDKIYGTVQFNAFFERASYGQTSLQVTAGDITSVLRMPATAAAYARQYANDELHDDARAAAAAAGYPVDSYDRVVVCFSYLGNLPDSRILYGGLGDVGERRVWLNGFQVALDHELGHTYGLNHADLFVTTDGTVTGSGTSEDGQDPVDRMGQGDPSVGEFNMWSRNLTGWLPDSSVTEVSQSGTFRIFRYDSQNANLGNPLSLKIPGTVIGDDLHDYWIGLRKNSPSSTNLANAAYILWGYHEKHVSDTLDMNPDSTHKGLRCGLEVGQAFSENGITIYPTKIAGSSPTEYMDIQIFIGNHPAVPVIGGTTAAAAEAGSPFSYTVVASNNPVLFDARNLPAGLAINADTGVITGIPQDVGEYTSQIFAGNAGGQTSKSLVIEVSPGSVLPKPTINSVLSVSGQVDMAFSYQIAATNSPVSFSASGLPLGLNVGASSGLISGTPNEKG